MDKKRSDGLFNTSSKQTEVKPPTQAKLKNSANNDPRKLLQFRQLKEGSVTTPTTAAIKNNHGIRHTAACPQKTEPMILGFLALKQLMWTCPDCLRVATIDPMDDHNPWGRSR